jgi:hypothetical protein
VVRVPFDSQVLERHFPEYAAREVERRNGWTAGSGIGIGEAARLSGISVPQASAMATAVGALATDEAGRRYTDRRHLPLEPKTAVESLLASEVPQWGDTATGSWLTYAEASALNPGVNLRTYETHTRVVRPGFGPGSAARRSTFIWVDDSVRRAVGRPFIEAAVEAAGIRLPPEDFLRLDEVVSALEEALPALARSTISARLRTAGVPRVRARTLNSRRLVPWVYFPRLLRTAITAAMASDYLAGRLETHQPLQIPDPRSDDPNHSTACAGDVVG